MSSAAPLTGPGIHWGWPVTMQLPVRCERGVSVLLAPLSLPDATL